MTSASLPLPPQSPAFAELLRTAGANHWEDASFPYRLAGDGFVLQRQSPAGTGAIGTIIRQGYVRGEPMPIAILRDLAVEPSARGQGLAKALIADALAEARSRGAGVALFTSPGPTAPIRALDRGFDDVPAFQRLASFVTIRLVVALGRWEESEYKIFRASNQDVPALAAHLDHYRRGLAFAPPTDAEHFQAGVAQSPGLSVSDFRIARYRDEMVAMTAVWEPGPALPIVTPPPTMLERVVGITGRTLGRLSPVVRLPKAGAPLRVRFIRAYAFKRDHQAAFRYLVDRAANEARKAGAHAIEFTAVQGDPILDGIRGRLRRVHTPSLWAAPLTAEVSLTDLGPADAGILDPGF